MEETKDNIEIDNSTDAQKIHNKCQHNECNKEAYYLLVANDNIAKVIRQNK